MSTISEILNKIHKAVESDAGLKTILDNIGDDEDLTVFALCHLASNLEDILSDLDPGNEEIETCDICNLPIPIGEGLETPCGVWCHADDVCYDEHRSDCLKFECQNTGS